jgi:hypothetical protein
MCIEERHLYAASNKDIASKLLMKYNNDLQHFKNFKNFKTCKDFKSWIEIRVAHKTEKVYSDCNWLKSATECYNIILQQWLYMGWRICFYKQSNLLPSLKTTLFQLSMQIYQYRSISNTLHIWRPTLPWASLGCIFRAYKRPAQSLPSHQLIHLHQKVAETQTIKNMV